jgi:hypothetical protein
MPITLDRDQTSTVARIRISPQYEPPSLFIAVACVTMVLVACLGVWIYVHAHRWDYALLGAVGLFAMSMYLSDETRWVDVFLCGSSARFHVVSYARTRIVEWPLDTPLVLSGRGWSPRGIRWIRGTECVRLPAMNVAEASAITADVERVFRSLGPCVARDEPQDVL